MTVLTPEIFRAACEAAEGRPEPQPTFLSQRDFRMLVEAAEAAGHEPDYYFKGMKILIHPEALRWYQEHIAAS